jgi:hypothetical protein
VTVRFAVSHIRDDIVEGFISDCTATLVKKVLGCFRLLCWPIYGSGFMVC